VAQPVIPVYRSLDHYINEEFCGHSRVVLIRVLVATHEDVEDGAESDDWHFEEVRIPRDGTWTCLSEPDGSPREWGLDDAWSVSAKDEFEAAGREATRMLETGANRRRAKS
jgi:hypothetical protein